MRDRANPPPPAPTPPPLDATLTRIDYDLRIDGEAIGGRALIAIDVLREGWTRVQIPAGLMVRDARLDGGAVSLVEGPPPHVLLSRAGRAQLALDIVVPLAGSAGSESIALPPAAAPISRVTLTLPRGGVDLTVTGGFVTDRAETADESRFTIAGVPHQPLLLSWKRRVDDRRAEQPLRTRARITSLVGLGEDVSQLSAAVRLEVVQGLAREVTMSIPPGLTINQVNGATVAEWEVTAGQLRVRLLDPVATDAAFVIQGEIRTPRDGAVQVPLIRIPNAERETGGVAVEVAGAGEIAARLARGMEPADPSELGEPVVGRDSPSMIAYRLRPLPGSEARSLDVTVVRYTPQAVLVANVEEARYRTLVAEDGRMLVQARYAVRNNQRSFLKVSLPPESTLWSASVAGRPMRPGVAEKDAVLLPLEKARAGEEAPAFVVEIAYLQPVAAWPDKGRVQIQLPALDLPVLRTGLEVYHSPRFEVAVEPGTFRVEVESGPFAAALRMPVAHVSGTAGGTVVRDQPAFQVLIDRFNSEAGARMVAGVLPVHVTFPEFGTSLFLASELTAESQTPRVELTVKRSRS